MLRLNCFQSAAPHSRLLGSLAVCSSILMLTFSVASAQDSGSQQNKSQQQSSNSAQDDQEGQQSSDNQQKSSNDQQQSSDQQGTDLGLTMVELKHVSYSEMKSLLTLHGLNDCFLGGPDSSCFIAFDVDSGTMFLRASESKTQKIKEIVKRFDVSSDKFPSQVDVGEDRIGRLIPRADASRVTMLLRQLGYDVDEQTLVGDRLVIYGKSDSKKVEEIEKIVGKIVKKDKDDSEKQQQASN